MPNYWAYIAMNHSILFPAAAAGARAKTLPRGYLPFALLLWLGALNETLSLLLAYTVGSNAANGNVYVLAEYFLLLWLFMRWNRAPPPPYLALAVAGAAVWALDNLVFGSIAGDNSVFRAFYAAVVAGFAVDRLNRLAVFEKRDLLKNPQFLACAALLLYFGCKVFAESLNAFHLDLGAVFYMRLWLALSFVNCASNIVYGTAVLCIPKKQEFIWPY